jgi:alkanesulfonate monooxygenase SsuD/methylene tetrahydromethanopterin reductase-like flavin-dependent oxidoreductase (luciferase family)
MGRRALGPVSAFLPNNPGAGLPSADVQRDAVRRLERAGYQSVWNNEGVGGKDGLVQLGVLLAATERMTFGSAIANIWAGLPQTAHGAAALLADAYPGRFVLGLGVGYPFQAAQIGRDYGRPLATIRGYFEQMAADQPLAQVPELSYPRILAANGPKMLALAAEIADGAMPILVPPQYTANARQVLARTRSRRQADGSRGRRSGPGLGRRPAVRVRDRGPVRLAVRRQPDPPGLCRGGDQRCLRRGSRRDHRMGQPRADRSRDSQAPGRGRRSCAAGHDRPTSRPVDQHFARRRVPAQRLGDQCVPHPLEPSR